MRKPDRRLDTFREALRAPLTPAVPGAPRRPIDDAKWAAGGVMVEPQLDPANRTFRLEGRVEIEIAPRPSWMRPETYAGLLRALRAKTTARGELQPGETIDRRDRWAARHVTLVMWPPKFVSDTSLGDRADTATLVRAALEVAAEAKRRGIDPRELGRPQRRRLLG